MKKLVIAAVAALLLCLPVSYAANTVTEITRINMRGKTVVQYLVSADTASSDITIHTPTTGNKVFVMGVEYSDSSASTITWKSGSTTIMAVEGTTYQGLWEPVTRDAYYFATDTSGALKVNFGTNAVTNMVVSVYEGAEF